MYFPEETLSQMMHFLLERMKKDDLRGLIFDQIKVSFDFEANILPGLSGMVKNLKEL